MIRPRRTSPRPISILWTIAPRTCVLAISGLFALATATAALGENAGRVWTNSVGQPASSGQGNEPHLTCKNIDLRGANLAHESGGYEIVGLPPSGSKEEVVYASSWEYKRPPGGSQVISTINVKTLIETATAHGERPVNRQGYHFKLQLSQEPQKHKTFWLNCQLADLSIAKDTSVATVGPGVHVLYRLTVVNHGPNDATGVTVSDTPPAGVSLSLARASQGSCTITGGSLSCALGDLAAGGSAQVLVAATTSASASGNLTNSATVAANQPDPNRGNNTGSGTVSVPSSPPASEQPANLEVTGQVDHTTADVGKTLTVKGVVDNLGPGTARDVELVATPSQAVKLVSVIATAGHCAYALPLRCRLGTIPAGAKVTIRAVLIPLRAGSLRSAASVTGAEPHPTTANNLAIVITPIKKRATRRAPPRPRRPPPVTG